jgi:hypothetical protein
VGLHFCGLFNHGGLPVAPGQLELDQIAPDGGDETRQKKWGQKDAEKTYFFAPIFLPIMSQPFFMSDNPSQNANSQSAPPRSRLVCVFVAFLITVVYVLHQDSWNWTKAAPMVFGFLPPGLAYHAAYSIGTSIMMAVLVAVAWPKHLEKQEDQPKSRE